MDKNKDEHEEAGKTKDKTKNKGQTPKVRHSSISDITQYLTPKPYSSLFGNYMEDNKRNQKDDDDSSDTSPQLKPLTKKERKNNKKDHLPSGIPKSSGSLAGSK